MTTNAKPLIDAKRAENSTTTQYTATNVVAIVDTFTVHNTNVGSITFAVNVVPLGATAGADNIFLNKSIAPGQTYTCPGIVGQILKAGDFLSTIAGAAASLTIRASGREIS